MRSERATRDCSANAFGEGALRVSRSRKIPFFNISRRVGNAVSAVDTPVDRGAFELIINYRPTFAARACARSRIRNIQSEFARDSSIHRRASHPGVYEMHFKRSRARFMIPHSNLSPHSLSLSLSLSLPSVHHGPPTTYGVCIRRVARRDTSAYSHMHAHRARSRCTRG